jgi:hypothetical protein
MWWYGLFPIAHFTQRIVSLHKHVTSYEYKYAATHSWNIIKPLLFNLEAINF